MSGGGRESEGEVGRVKGAGVKTNSKTSRSHSVGIANENGDSIDLDQVTWYNSILICMLHILIYVFFYFNKFWISN